jgi:hypothetical protein
MNVWIENYDGCECAWICLYKQDLPGFCTTHGTRSLGTSKLFNYSGEVGYTEGGKDGNPA